MIIIYSIVFSLAWTATLSFYHRTTKHPAKKYGCNGTYYSIHF